MGVIYKITNPKGKIYVGQTIDFDKRKKRYGWESVAVKQRMLYHSLMKYGYVNHVFEILEDNIAPENLNEKEIFWIKETKSYCKDSPLGMNLNRGGNTAIWDKKRIAAHSQKFKGDKNSFFGKKHTQESKDKMSKKLRVSMVGYKPTRLAVESGIKAKSKAIVVYDKEGSFYSEFPSLTSFAKSLGVDVTTIRDVLRNNGWVKKTYTCRYKTEDYPLRIAL